jgi:hypothetical protein
MELCSDKYLTEAVTYGANDIALLAEHIVNAERKTDGSMQTIYVTCHTLNDEEKSHLEKNFHIGVADLNSDLNKKEIKKKVNAALLAADSHNKHRSLLSDKTSASLFHPKADQQKNTETESVKKRI